LQIILNEAEQNAFGAGWNRRQTFYVIFTRKRQAPVAIFSNKKSAEYWQKIYLKESRIKQVRVRLEM